MFLEINSLDTDRKNASIHIHTEAEKELSHLDRKSIPTSAPPPVPFWFMQKVLGFLIAW